MVRVSVIVLVLALASPARAMTWDFASGTQGWHARDGQCAVGGACTPLRSVAEDGVWRVTPLYTADVTAMVDLVSPTLQRAASLFDRLEVRFRVVHPDPFMGQLGLYWEAKSSDSDGRRWHAQLYAPPTLFSGEWQTLTVADIAQHEMTTPGAWDGVLTEIGVRLVLSEGRVNTADAVPELVEIDSIRLTGTEEQLNGELPPPDPAVLYYGTYLEAPTFYPLLRGAGAGNEYRPGAGVLADLDGDGRLDVLAGRAAGSGAQRSWLCALGDGAGGFGPVRVETAGTAVLSGPTGVAATDLNGDGRTDVVVTDSYPNAQVLYNAGDGGWEEGDALRNHMYLGAGDLEGDGDQDLWFAACDPDPIGLVVLLAGPGSDLRRAETLMQPHDGGMGLSAFPVMLTASPGTARSTSVLIRPPLDQWGFDPGLVTENAFYTGYRLMTWREGAFAELPVAIAANINLIESVVDSEGDGDLDFVLGDHYTVGFSGSRAVGLSVAVAQADGSYQSLPWLDWPLLRTNGRELKWADLDGDGVLDVVFPDRASSGPALVVCVGQKGGGLPVVEGRYELGGIPEEVLVGDVNGDAAPDLVVVESTYGSAGGVEVFLNRMDHGTAVCESGREPLPAAAWLGASYPNPFNAGTVIPMAVPAGLGSVRVSVYDLVGQPVRRLVDGILSPGVHTVPWDGRDVHGREVAAGIYLCRLEAGGAVLVRKLAKVE